MNETCRTCGFDEEGREARPSACFCIERAEEKRNAERTHKIASQAAATLLLGIEGAIDRDQAYADAFTALYSHLYGPAETARVMAEGKRL